MLSYAVYESIVGTIYIVANNEHLIGVYIGEENFRKRKDSEQIRIQQDHQMMIETIKQFDQYFNGTRKIFQLPLYKSGTPFQLQVWDALLKIPFGETKSYQEIAESIGRPKALRAVGQANKANKFPIIIPCHRVIGKNKSLTGYAGKRTDIKEKLLILEGVSVE
ncbi:methylated-DNA--[protein]-cysteine S-methyltransferase [Bacillus aquiflavi]|uniref:Methylated-DNA--protein-cysteine methyltransferase n=1 Tax=Bacillus aquiflavi TaxID=2672567 RepID=A0A6B3VZE1_9BACI|nr:methylated-DNA--[protein]-cysteine S-methyltransferase [Bacillus aquiflavi]NEY81627.1 methylated-DNA--[protein]-cysteine S-methyltransferase [Bacillus aquiflavi]